MNNTLNKPASVIGATRFSPTVCETASSQPIGSDDLVAHKRNTNRQSVKSDEATYRSYDQTLFLQQLLAVLDRNLAQATFTVEKLAESMAVCPRTLHRKTVVLTTLSPTKLIRLYRLIRAMDLLKQGCLVSDSANAVGFENLSYFTRCFTKQFKLSPSTYQKQEEMLNLKIGHM